MGSCLRGQHDGIPPHSVETFGHLTDQVTYQGSSDSFTPADAAPLKGMTVGVLWTLVSGDLTVNATTSPLLNGDTKVRISHLQEKPFEPSPMVIDGYSSL